jgi:hypothetical protein
MPVLSKPSAAAFTSLTYITLGALIDVWSVIWYVYLTNTGQSPNDPVWYWCYGFLLTGLALRVIGFGLGQIGRAARHAELPPMEVTAQEAKVEQTAAARAPMVVPVNPAAVAVAPNGPGVVPTAQVAAVPGPAGVAPVPRVAPAPADRRRT